MKFTVVKSLQHDKDMRPILTGLLLFTLLYTLSDIFVKHLNFGVLPRDIDTTLFGDEEQYIDPLTQSAFLELWHMEIFFMMMILLTLSAVFIRVAKQTWFKTFSINLLMLSSIGSLLVLVLSFFLMQALIPLYSVLFLTWHITAVYMIVYSLWQLHYDTKL